MTDLGSTWEELRTRLKRYVRSKVDRDASEDLVHDILLRVLENEDALANKENPSAWIYAVARNRITDYYRQRSVAGIAHQTYGADREDQETILPLDALDKEFSDCLRPLILRLEPKYQEALLLSDLGETKQSDAAEQIGISLSGMKSRVQRGRAQLKSVLLACCAIEQDRFGKVVSYQPKDDTEENACC